MREEQRQVAIESFGGFNSLTKLTHVEQSLTIRNNSIIIINFNQHVLNAFYGPKPCSRKMAGEKIVNSTGKIKTALKVPACKTVLQDHELPMALL